MLAHVHSLFLDDLLLAVLVLCAVWTEALVVWVVAVACVAALFEEGLVAICCTILLLDDEVRWATQISLIGSTLDGIWVLLQQLVRILTNILEQLSPLSILCGPLCDVVIWLLLLKALEDHLIFSCDFHKFSLTGLSIQRLLVLEVTLAGHGWDTLRLGGHRLVTHLTEMSIGVRDALWILKDVRHLFKQDAVLSLDLRVPLYSKQIDIDVTLLLFLHLVRATPEAECS